MQLAFVLKDFITMGASILLGVFAVFFFADQFPDLAAFALPIVVIGTVVVALINGNRVHKNGTGVGAEDEVSNPADM